MQNIIKSLINSGGGLYKFDELQIHCSPYERWVNLQSGYTHRVQILTGQQWKPACKDNESLISAPFSQNSPFWYCQSLLLGIQSLFPESQPLFPECQTLFQESQPLFPESHSFFYEQLFQSV